MKSREILKIGIRSLVEVYDTDENGTEITSEYVVCSYYDHTQKMDEQWCWGHYFNVVNSQEKENKLKTAMNYILDNERTTEDINTAKELLNKKMEKLYELYDSEKISEDDKNIIDSVETAINILTWCSDHNAELKDVTLVGRFKEWKIKELDKIIDDYKEALLNG